MSRSRWTCGLLVLMVMGCNSGGGPNPQPEPQPQPQPQPAPGPTGPSSTTLIDAALARGEIDEETAFTYEIFAAFADSRLPAAYHGDDRGVFETDAVTRLPSRFDTLSPAAQATLGPFLLRPSAIGSWLDLRSGSASHGEVPSADARVATASSGRPTCRGESSGWTTINGSSARVNVWYRFATSGQKEKAAVVSAAIESDILPALVDRFMFRAPLDDSNPSGCFGGSGKLDVYLVSGMSDRGRTTPEGLDPTNAPVFVELNTDALTTDDQLRAGAAHEMMHVIQWALKTKSPQVSYGWMRDALANWAIDYIYPKPQVEQDYADCFTRSPELSLDDRSKGHCTHVSGAARDYGAYLFFQFIAHTQGPAVVIAALGATTTAATSFEAVDGAIPGGFKNQWPLFAKALWNKPPIDTEADSFKQWDGLTDVPQTSELTGDLSGSPEESETLDSEQPSLSIRYYHFTFGDPNARSVLFYNGYFDQVKAGKAVTILAMWKDPAGQWVREDDWSSYQYVGLCRDLKAQRASELTIIVANAERDPGGKVTATKAPYLKRNNIGCYRYEGTATGNFKPASWSGQGKTTVASLAFQIPPGADAIGAKQPSIPDSLRLGLTSVMPVVGTSVTLTESYGSGTCSFSFGPATFPIGAGSQIAGGVAQINPFPELRSTDPSLQAFLSDPARAYLAAVVDNQPVTVSVSGQACGTSQMDVVGVLLGTSTVSSPQRVQPDGTMQGTYAPTSSTVFVWTFTPKSEP